MRDLFETEPPLDASRTMTLYDAFYQTQPLPIPSGAVDEMRFVDRLTDCLDECEGFILDSYGVIGLGSAPIPGIQEFFKQLQRRDVPFVILTNGASKPAEARVPGYQSWDLPITASDIVSSRDACYQHLLAYRDKHPECRITYLGSGVRPFDDIPGTIYGSAGWDEADLYCFMGAIGWTPADQLAFEAALHQKPAVIVTANPDVSAPQVSGFSYEPGYWAMRAKAHTGCEVVMTGKPYGPAFQLAVTRLEAKAGRSLTRSKIGMVGDSLHTDILGANSFGLRSILLRSFGLMSGFDCHEMTRRMQIYPALVAEII